MEFFKNFYREDDKIIGLCAFKKQKQKKSENIYFERRFNSSNLAYNPQMNANMFRY